MRPLSSLLAHALMGSMVAAASASDLLTPKRPRSTPVVAQLPPAPMLLPSATTAGTRTLRVGPGAEFAAPSSAAAVARDGDTVEIEPGDYRGDVAVWSANRLRIVGGTPRPAIDADGRHAQGKGTWVVRGDDVTIENVEMSGARVPEGNGAAIRFEGRNLTLRKVYLHDNENGLLCGVNLASEISIDQSEFARNGSGTGYTHNLYIGEIGKLVVTKSYFHHAIAGHNLKSRAAISIISDSRFADEGDGRASYSAEFPNGGRVTLAFNIFQKGPDAQNQTMVSYGAEGLRPQGTHELVAKGNTFVSKRPGNTRFIYIAPATASITINGNVFAGPGALPEVAAVKANNAVQRELPGNAELKPEGL